MPDRVVYCVSSVSECEPPRVGGETMRFVGMSSPSSRASRASSLMSASAALIGSALAWFQSSIRTASRRTIWALRGLLLGHPSHPPPHPPPTTPPPSTPPTTRPAPPPALSPH